MVDVVVSMSAGETTTPLTNRNHCGLHICMAHWWRHCLLAFRLLADDFDHWWHDVDW